MKKLIIASLLSENLSMSFVNAVNKCASNDALLNGKTMCIWFWQT